MNIQMKRKQLLLVGIVFVAVYLLARRGRELFTEWPGAGVRAQPPIYAPAKESFVNKTCPDGTRSDGPCLLEFPTA